MILNSKNNKHLSRHTSNVLVLDASGTNLGMMPYQDAFNLATSQELDLVLINKTGDVQVYKVMDHGKYKYENKKNKQKQKKSHAAVKEVNFKVRIDPHDQKIKIDQIRKFLSKGSEVRITVIMRGREKSNPSIAHNKMVAILSDLEDAGLVQQKKTNPSTIYASVKPIESKKKWSNKNATNNETIEHGDGGVKAQDKKQEENRKVCSTH